MKRTILFLLAVLGIAQANAQDLRKTSPEKKNVKTTTMKTDLITNQNVAKAISALQDADKEQWFSLFAQNTVLFDDGHKMDFRCFFEKALGHERFTAIDKVENNSMDIFGRFHSDQWGDFKTYFKFHMGAEGKFDRLEIGQASY